MTLKVKQGIKKPTDYKNPYLYKTFKYQHDYIPMHKIEHSKILLSIFSKLRHEIYKGYILKLPYNLGYIGIEEKKPIIRFNEDGTINKKGSSLTIDYKATRELWEEYPELQEKKKVVYFENEHTSGNKYKIKWRHFGKNKNISVYAFKPTRRFSRELAQYLKSNPNTNYYDF